MAIKHSDIIVPMAWDIFKVPLSTLQRSKEKGGGALYTLLLKAVPYTYIYYESRGRKQEHSQWNGYVHGTYSIQAQTPPNRDRIPESM
jgi:hypothetical protein